MNIQNKIIETSDVKTLAAGVCGAVYHITSRGDRRENIFDDDDDRLMWLEVLAEALESFDATVFAWCLMSNHYHIVLRTRRANLSRLMRHLNGVYTQRYNRRHGKVGHLYQGRFKGILVQEDAYLLEVCRYVDLNPVRARMVAHPGEWPWSSYAALTGEVPSAAWHDRATVLAMVAPDKGIRAAQNAYARFVAQGRGGESVAEQGYARADHSG
jgi:putative transposase